MELGAPRLLLGWTRNADPGCITTHETCDVAAQGLLIFMSAVRARSCTTVLMV